MEVKKSLSEMYSIIKIKRSRIVALMTLLLSLLALYAALAGIFDKSLYEDALLAGSMNNFLVVGSIAQDIITIPIGLVLCGISLIFIRNPNYKTFIALIGLTTGFFYNYGLYVIQGQYTSIYIVYLAVFSLSIYSLIFGLLSFQPYAWNQIKIPGAMRKSIGVFLATIVLVLGPGWLIKISPDIAKHIPADTYGVYILDLGIVFPALGIIIVKLLKNRPFNAILAGVALFKAFTVCLAWGFAQWFGPIYSGLPFDVAMTAIPTVLTTVSLAFIFLYFSKLKED